MKTELTEIRNRLYDILPSGDVSAWELLQAVKRHLDELDGFIDKMDTQCVLSDVVGRSEQLVCQCEIPNVDMQGICFKCNLKVGVRPAN